MINHIREQQFLVQTDAAHHIEVEFGPEWVYENENGNKAIDKAVLAYFRSIKPTEIEWDRSDRGWSIY